MMKHFTVFLITTISATGSLSAAEPARDAKTWSYSCVKASELENFKAEGPAFKINNLSVVEKKAFTAKPLTQLVVSFSVVNRGNENAYLSADVLALDKDSLPLAALSANPPFDLIAPGSTDTVKGDTFVPAGTLAKADLICYRFGGTALPETVAN
ncbi:hypothetical protein [Rhizobium sp. ZX09]|uniref:hypothetical protein n=1 Tax=Rhizobium sp. ZX09 TaxID=2291939 RepID=UPI001A995CC3|nr:hypothetical protein [Rhizobium sp. ZX09]QSZ56850.1 hypothetical protein BTN45_06835 [Rhizobium sp. ZX09]